MKAHKVVAKMANRIRVAKVSMVKMADSAAHRLVVHSKTVLAKTSHKASPRAQKVTAVHSVVQNQKRSQLRLSQIPKLSSLVLKLIHAATSRPSLYALKMKESSASCGALFVRKGSRACEAQEGELAFMKVCSQL